MKNNDCLFSDIQNLCNAVSNWLIQKINNPIETNETISCACCHICVITSKPVNGQPLLRKLNGGSQQGLLFKLKNYKP